MGELGADSEAEHRHIVERLKGYPDVDVMLVGKEFGQVAAGLPAFADTDALISDLQKNPLSGTHNSNKRVSIYEIGKMY